VKTLQKEQFLMKRQKLNMTNNTGSITACFIPARQKVCVSDDLSLKCYDEK